jgi:hypothetical protein
LAKDAQDRLKDTLGYIRDHISGELAEHIDALIVDHRATIGNELSLGARWDVTGRDATTEQRRALRALLLCQRVYFSDLWPSLFGVVATREAVNWLPQGWKDQSCQFWANRTELDLRQALRMFIATSDDPTFVANAATKGQASAPVGPYLTATRETFIGNPTATCYDAVMLWLFRSGLVSMRWLQRYRNGNTQATLTEAFGPGLIIWDGAFKAGNSLPAVPRGHIVHIFENPASWRGHWMISTGGARAAGCNNNNEDPPVARDYYATLSLDKQFLDFEGGTAVVINPARIPGRL